MKARVAWAPAVLMGFGALFTVAIDTQRTMSLVEPLDSVIPMEIEGYVAEGVQISDAELNVAAPTEYLMRMYIRRDSTGQSPPWFSVYVGFYGQQTQGTTIHSPKNCLPGAGWEALESETVSISQGNTASTANRYILQRNGEQALVLYWYQGRGRTEANEYMVKWNLLRDAVLRQRSDEALVRIVVPLVEGDESAMNVALKTAELVVRTLKYAIPG